MVYSMTYIQSVGVSTGTIIPYGAATAPTGYLLCDGSAISRTTYSALFAIISTTYGVGDGSTTFNLPDLQGNIPVGIGASGVTNLGDTGGEQTHTLVTSEMPAHVHSEQVYGYSGSSPTFSGAGTLGKTAPNTGSTGGDGAHQNMQPYVGTEYIIKT
jgi:microcystin-dependent protein